MVERIVQVDHVPDKLATKLADREDPTVADLIVALESCLELAQHYPDDHAVDNTPCIPSSHQACGASGILANVLSTFGMPPGQEGKELLRQAIRRRIAEGSESGVQLQLLAVGAGLVLGQLPHRDILAEDFLASKADELASKAEGADLARRCRQLIARRLAAATISARCATALAELLHGAHASAASVMSLLGMASIGLTTATLLGDDLNPPEVPFLESISPREFETHVLPGRPAVFRGCLDKMNFPPLETFLDFAHLRSLCGHRRIPVKSIVHSDRTGRQVFAGDPEQKLPFGDYLSMIEEHEASVGDSVGRAAQATAPFYMGKTPLRTELPELADEVEHASTCPKRLYGECFGSLRAEGAFAYFGCGRNTTPVHFDAHENLLFCVAGTKRLVLYHPSEAVNLYPLDKFAFSAVPPFTPFDELPKELQMKYPRGRMARSVEVLLNPGDLLYLPACWWHGVEGSEDRNMGLSWWFELHPDKRALARDE